MGHITCKTVPTTGIIGAIAGDCFGAAYEFHPVSMGTSIYTKILVLRMICIVVTTRALLGNNCIQNEYFYDF